MGNYITSGAAALKAGAHVSGAITEIAWNGWISGAESMLNVLARKNFSDDYAGLNDDVKYIMVDTGASMVAMDAVKWDMSGYTSRIEAEDTITILRDNVLRGMSILRDKKAQDFMDGA